MTIYYTFLMLSACFAALIDFLIYRIPNILVLFIGIIFLAKTFLFSSAHALIQPLMVLGISLVICFLLYMAKIIGGGDAKFIAVMTMAMTDFQVVTFLFAMSLAGGVLGLMYLKIPEHLDTARHMLLKQLNQFPIWKEFYKKRQSGETRIDMTKKVTPYGVAVFAGALITFIMAMKG